jgi:membrane-associated protease RseP (regulator of RpoE activity)
LAFALNFVAIVAAIWPILPLLVIYLVVWGIICVAWWVFKGERFGITGLPYYIVYRTARLNAWIGRVSERRPMAWRTIWNVGVVMGVGAMIFIFYKLATNLLYLFVGSQQASPTQIIVPVPGIFVTFQTFPFLALALSICLVSHELAHGIASLGERVPLKSTGAFFVHVFMGAFVEPDEEKLNQARPATKLRVFAAGSFANLILGFLCIILLANFAATITPFYSIVPSGVSVISVSPSLPAYGSGLQTGDTLTSINGTTISNVNDLRQYMAGVTPGQVVDLQTQRGTFDVRTVPDPSNSSHALMGISLADNIKYVPKIPFLSENLPSYLLRAENWAYIVLISVGLINMLPADPLDGGKFLDTALAALGIGAAKQIRMVAFGAAWGILLANIGLSLLRFGFVRP